MRDTNNFNLAQTFNGWQVSETGRLIDAPVTLFRDRGSNSDISCGS